MLHFACRRSLAPLLVVCAFAGSREASAEIVTFQARGVVNRVLNFGQTDFGAYPAGLAAGDEFVLTYSIETSTPAFLNDGAQARYGQAVTALSFDLKDTHYDFGSDFFDEIYLANDQERLAGTFTDAFSLRADQPIVAARPITFDVWLSMATMNAATPPDGLTSLDLTATPPNIAGFDGAAIQITAFLASTGQSNDLFGTVTCVSAVPVPAAAWLLASGLGGVLALRRRRAGLPLR